MKSIIEELKLNNPPIITENIPPHSVNTVDFPASPVYSLPDEDRTQMIEFMNNNLRSDNISNSVDEEEENIPNVTLNTSLLEDVIKGTEVQTESRVKEIKSSIEKNRNVDNELTESIIDLTLNDQEEQQNVNFMDSQSIIHLDIVDNANSDIYQKITSDSCGQDISEVDKEINRIIQDKNRITTGVNDQIHIDMENTMNISSIEVNKTEAKTGNVSVKLNKTFEIQDNFSEISKKNVETKLKKPKHENKVNKSAKEKNSKDSNKTKIGRKKLKPILKNNYTKTLNNTTEKQCDTFVPLPKHFNENCSVVKSLIDVSKTVDSNKLVRKYIESDLSWIENIRYIREVHIEEYDQNLNSLTDSFWENCILPGDWDDRDFD